MTFFKLEIKLCSEKTKIFRIHRDLEARRGARSQFRSYIDVTRSQNFYVVT